MKLITFAIPSYNSAAYLHRCVDSLPLDAEDVEILVVDDGSTDATGEIAARYAQAHPDIVRVIRQENGGHGAAVNAGLQNARGLYFKIVDSDDWLDREALKVVLSTLRGLASAGESVDLLATNYVYEHPEENTRCVMRLNGLLPAGRVLRWSDLHTPHPWRNMTMHTLIFRAEVLRESGLELPRHTFYVDNIYAYQPLPYVRSLYYLDVDLYRYYIGRADQSVNERVWTSRYEQQLRVAETLLRLYDSERLGALDRRCRQYMASYLTIVLVVTEIVLTLRDTDKSLAQKREMWTSLKSRDPALYRTLRRRPLVRLADLPTAPGRKTSLFLYRVARRIFKFE